MDILDKFKIKIEGHIITAKLFPDKQDSSFASALSLLDLADEILSEDQMIELNDHVRNVQQKTA